MVSAGSGSTPAAPGRQRPGVFGLHGHAPGHLRRHPVLGATEWIARGKPTTLGAASGAVAGLVAITPAAGYVGPMAAILIGIAPGSSATWQS